MVRQYSYSGETQVRCHFLSFSKFNFADFAAASIYENAASLGNYFVLGSWTGQVYGLCLDNQPPTVFNSSNCYLGV